MSASAPNWKRGEFYSFRATNKIHLGKYETDILNGDEFDYDGYTVRYAGTEYGVPQLQGLCGSWFVTVSDTTTQYQAKPAGVQVRPATPEAEGRGDAFTMGEASEEEAVVGTLGESREIRTAAREGRQERLEQLRGERNRQARRRAGEPMDPMADSNPNAPPPENAADVDPEVEAALMEHAEETFVRAEPAHRGGRRTASASPDENAAVARANAINRERILAREAELKALDQHKSAAEMGGQRHDNPEAGQRRVGKGGKYALVVEGADDYEAVKQYKFSDGAAVGGDGVGGSMKGTDVTKVSSRRPVQVGNAVASTPQNREAGAMVIPDPMTTHQPQAVRARQTTQVQREGNVGIDEVLPGGGTGDVDEVGYGDDLADLLPGAAVAGRVRPKAAAATPKPAPAPQPTEADEIAEVVDGWNTKRNWQKRVEEAVEFYADWPEALEGIYGIESPAVIKQIKSKISRKDAAAKKG